MQGNLHCCIRYIIINMILFPELVHCLVGPTFELRRSVLIRKRSEDLSPGTGDEETSTMGLFERSPQRNVLQDGKPCAMASLPCLWTGE